VVVRNSVPTAPGGGTVAFVDPIGHQYLDDPVAREEGGTPAIVESIRAGLVFALKQAVGTGLIAAREERLWRYVLHRWAGSPGIEVLGNRRAARLSIVSFRIRHGTQYLHHNFVVALLNDLFGIQARGGCSCAGPYGHRLLAIGPARSHALREEIGHGCDGVKPGWTRVNLNYFISQAAARYIAAAVELIAADGYRLLPDYRFDPRTGLWRHAAGPPTPPLTLADVRYGQDGEMSYPRQRARAGEAAFPGYLRQARAILAGHPADLDQGPTGLPAEFEALRWFPLPPACLPATARNEEHDSLLYGWGYIARNPESEALEQLIQAVRGLDTGPRRWRPRATPARAPDRRSVDQGPGAVGHDLGHEGRGARDPDAVDQVLGLDVPAGRALGAHRDGAGGQDPGQQVGQRRGVREREVPGAARQPEPRRLPGQPQRHAHPAGHRRRGDGECLVAPLRVVLPGRDLDDKRAFGHG
jgi:hypothetical protein